jgi:hypothetical protein
VLIDSLKAFEDPTAFERHALAVDPLPQVASGEGAVLDLRGDGLPITGIGLAPIWSDCTDVLNRLRPLLFGAAWKVLDFAIEFGFHQAGSSGDRNDGT